MKIVKVIVPFIITFFLSCDKKEASLVNNNAYDKSEKEVAIADFPDTIHINKIYQGNITYTSKLDTITRKLNGNNDIRRYIMLIYYPPINLGRDKGSGKIPSDTTFAYKLPDVPIRDIQFKEEGHYQLEWVIKDMVIFDTIKSRTGAKELPMKVEETRITKKVIVLDQ